MKRGGGKGRTEGKKRGEQGKGQGAQEREETGRQGRHARRTGVGREGSGCGGGDSSIFHSANLERTGWSH
eukprot:86907-Hanusia_phi.AAC.4